MPVGCLDAALASGARDRALATGLKIVVPFSTEKVMTNFKMSMYGALTNSCTHGWSMTVCQAIFCSGVHFEGSGKHT
jgi:hypothetical protein